MRLLLSVSFLCFLLGAPSLRAHRSPEGLTTITRNPNTGHIEIIHHLHASDAEEALSKHLQDKEFSLDTLQGKAQLALYVEQRFQIADAETGKPVELVLIGAELEGDTALVFQEFPGNMPSSLKLRNDILKELFPDQRNTVNLSRGRQTQTQTLVFKKKGEWKPLELKP